MTLRPGETPPAAPAPAPAPGPAPAPAAPAPAPLSEVDRVLKSAAEAKDEQLGVDELKKVISERAKLVEGAKKMTGTALDQLSSTLRREQQEHEAELAVDTSKAELQTLRAEIDAAAVAKAAKVTDVEVIDPNKKKTFVDSLKSFANTIGLAGIGGSLLRFWKSIRNTLIDVGVPLGKKEDLNDIEQKYNAYFGGAELRDIANNVFKDKGIEVAKGSKDPAGYMKIQSRYNAALAAKIAEVAGKDATGKPNEITPAMRGQIEAGMPFKKFFQEEILDRYATKFTEAAPAGQKRVTTIYGIANSEKPTLTTA